MRESQYTLPSGFRVQLCAEVSGSQVIGACFHYNGGAIVSAQPGEFAGESFALYAQTRNQIGKGFSFNRNPALESLQAIVARFQPGNLHHGIEALETERALFAAVLDDS